MKSSTDSEADARLVSRLARRAAAGRKYYKANKEMIAEKSKKYNKANKEMIAEKSKKYNKANKEALNKASRAYYAANKEVIAKKDKKYREANKEKTAEQKKKYNKANKEKIAEQKKKYYEANKMEDRSRRKKYREANKDKIAEQKKKYNKANKEKLAKDRKKYYEATREERCRHSRIRYTANKETLNKASRAYYAANKEVIAGQNKARYEANKEKRISQSKVYYEDNKEVIIKRSREYREDNKEAIAASRKKYRKDKSLFRFLPNRYKITPVKKLLKGITSIFEGNAQGQYQSPEKTDNELLYIETLIDVIGGEHALKYFGMPCDGSEIKMLQDCIGVIEKDSLAVEYKMHIFQALKAAFARLSLNIPVVKGDVNIYIKDKLDIDYQYMHLDYISPLTHSAFAATVKALNYCPAVLITVQSNKNINGTTNGRILQCPSAYKPYNDGEFPAIPGMVQLWSNEYIGKSTLMTTYCLTKL